MEEINNLIDYVNELKDSGNEIDLSIAFDDNMWCVQVYDLKHNCFWFNEENKDLEILCMNCYDEITDDKYKEM